MAPIRCPFKHEKFMYLLKRHRGPVYCPIAREKWNRLLTVQVLHHKLVHNTKTDRCKYALMVHSLLNLVMTNNEAQCSFSSWGKDEAKAARIEKFLRRHWRMAYFVNNLKWVDLETAKKWAARTIGIEIAE